VGSNTGIASIPLAALAGLAVGLAVGLALYYSGRAIKDLKAFFVVSTIVLFFFAAGQVSLGTQMLSLAGAFGPYAVWQDDLAWHYRPVADLSACCSDEVTAPNKFFSLAHAVVGCAPRSAAAGLRAAGRGLKPPWL
jgi:high-affinity iron transporter